MLEASYFGTECTQDTQVLLKKKPFSFYTLAYGDANVQFENFVHRSLFPYWKHGCPVKVQILANICLKLSQLFICVRIGHAVQNSWFN